MNRSFILVAVLSGLMVCVGCNTPREVGTRLNPPLKEVLQPLTLEQRLQAVAPVIDSFADALVKVQSKYPEMTAYRKENAKGQAGESIWCGYSHNFTRPTTKRGIAPSDFGKNGFTTHLSCRAMPPPDFRYAMSAPALNLNYLRLYVWAEVRTAPDPSVGLVDEINTIIRTHLEQLEEIDKTASNKANALDPPSSGQ